MTPSDDPQPSHLYVFFFVLCFTLILLPPFKSTLKK